MASEELARVVQYLLIFLDNWSKMVERDMDSNELVKEYHYCHDKQQDLKIFSDNCQNYYSLGLKLYILKEKLLDFIRIRFEAFIKVCKRDGVPVLRALKGRVRTKPHYQAKNLSHFLQ